ncbi:hypothetical protein [Plantactinospora soyae]|uniref:Uncharacterized protein n=1 Tax=Plantactinospora soyae TaxID=1544732 RepID=A0A927R821_9ACTN|nr:hypothetical protein [Plantactinospora soyae]MBE1490019.1 hypothetical protein [Plantactinospora soyae]
MNDTTLPTTAVQAAGPDHEPSGTRRRRLRHFLRHLAEMTVAMLLGMLLLGPVWEVIATGLGRADVLGRPDVDALVMATNMTLGMSIWMRHRGHRWGPVAQMGAAMYVPFLLFLPAYWLGAVSGEILLMAGHLLMLPAMVLAMLLRRDEYTRHHTTAAATGTSEWDAASSGDGAVGRTARRIVAILKHRWPTWLALVVTIDNWIDPFVLGPWVMLVLPIGYLLIGAVRRQLGNPWMLALQLGGLVGYLGLAVAAANASDDLARYLIGAGWLAHSFWDLAHHRANRVVPRGFSEWCAVVDAVIGISIIFLA